jgi:protein-S-isoprenylcysteine O-methyltransferase Ste14
VIFVLANLFLLLRAAKISWTEKKSPHPPAEIFGLAVGVFGFMLSIYPDMHLFTANLAPLYWMITGFLLAFTAQAPQLAEQPEHGTTPEPRSTWLTPAWRRQPDSTTSANQGRSPSKSSS